eukprot:CAMPEP_0171463426 /NCGR_PEP_ID=MMETSP0945-20130129/7103_1 /TAXON_ID=109269 /ORGANISM="Vaucheria litorea, Strain CCMP2940" /LENGTH=72 /DNA_ID=CAMNT_0011990219 /DNA_START=66 /DNA_END=284 /DNA_ORIENTATION=-
MAKDAATKTKVETKSTAPKKAKTKKLSAYNTYMKKELVKLKEELPDMPHSERFKVVAQRWKNAKENPKATVA